MAQDVYTMTPGSAVASTLQDILEQKRKESRQAMLDELQRQNVQSEMKARGEQADTNKVYREGLISDRKAREDDRKSELANERDLSGWAWNQWSEDPTVQGAYEMMGTDPKHGAELYKTILQQHLSQQQEKHPWMPVFHTDRAGNTWDTGTTAPQGAHFTSEPAPQQPSAASMPSLYQVERPDPNNPGKTTTVPIWLTPGQQIEQGKPVAPPPVGPNQPGQAPAQAGVRKGNEPPPKDVKPVSLYNTQQYDVYQRSLNSGSPNAAPARSSARRAWLNTVTEPAVKATVLAILAKKELRSKSADELIQAGVLHNTPADPQHTNKVKSVLDLIPLSDRENQ